MATYVIVGQMRWAVGNSLPAAKLKSRSFGGDLRNGYTVLEFAPGSEFHGVDQAGCHRYTGQPPTVTECPPIDRQMQ